MRRASSDTWSSRPTKLLEEKQFGEDDQAERSEFAVGDDIGVVRLSVSGAIAIREVKSGDDVRIARERGLQLVQRADRA